MAAGLALSAAQTLLAAVQCTTQLTELSSMFEYKSQLENLERSVKMIKAVLLESEIKNQELTHEGRVWFEELKDAVYDADDFFDELITKAQLNKLSQKKILKKVRRFLSRDNQLVSAFRTSQTIKMLREKLDSIADDHKKFGFSGEFRPVKRREETCSYVYEKTIIGRDEEKENIVQKLLSNLTSSVSFVSIVGMGGLGKTTLAHLIYNDERIRGAFSEGMYWVCVSEEFGFEEILCKFLDRKKNSAECTLEYLHKQVRQKIEGKRYFLVLDDVWEEDPIRWRKLREFLYSGGAGSRILITTRSRKVAEAAGKDLILELKGLSDENAWLLFKKIAFGEGVDNHDTRLVEIGKDIVKKCANVPLSIKVVSSLLHSQDESKWEAFRNIDLANMGCLDKEDHIMSALMFSYYNLTPELKSCFSICSLFKKDYKIEKESLISLWLAEGYLQGSDGKSMEDIGEEYFSILLQRCFLQDVERDGYGEIQYCKMHDLALKIAGKESTMLMASSTNDMEKKFRHLSVTHDAPIDFLYNKDCPSRQTLRTYINLLDSYKSKDVNVATLVFNYRHLRVLHLGCCDINFVHDQLGMLLQLRSLDVSNNYSLKTLPRSITKLCNLQILVLSWCRNLMELPHDIGKLVNLRTLKIDGCDKLTELPEDIVKLINLRILDIYNCYQLKELRKDKHEFSYYYDSKNSNCKIRYMPAGIDKLRSLHTLTYFVVGGDDSIKVQKEELADLKGLGNLKGHMQIKVLGCSRNNKRDATKGAQILREAQLKGLEIFCEDADDQGEYHETLLEGLYPNNYNLDTLMMRGYQGVKFPKWSGGTGTFPSGIVRMVLKKCVGLKHLSSLSKLVKLKNLHLSDMENLEYIERDAPSDVLEKFLPSLEILTLKHIKNLKGWWKDVTWKEKDGEKGSGCLVDFKGNCIELIPSFSRLCDLEINDCESLKYFPPCPQLKKLNLWSVNKEFHFCGGRSTCYHPNLAIDTFPSTSSLSSFSYLSSTHPTSFSLEEFINSQFLGGRVGNLAYLKTLKICFCEKLESLGEEEDDDDKEGLPWKSLTSLSSLELLHLKNLVKPPMGFQYLTSLGSLKINNCPKLEVESIMWKSLHSLSSLELDSLPKLVNLPKDFQQLSSLQSLSIQWCENFEGFGESLTSLTSLQSLHISYCPKLKSLPEAMRHLTSLTLLEICKPSSELKERCKKPDGEDWPKICHIRKIDIYG